MKTSQLWEDLEVFWKGLDAEKKFIQGLDRRPMYYSKVSKEEDLK